MKITAGHRLWVGLGLVVLGCLVWECVPARGPAHRLKALPAGGLGFASRELPLNPTETQIYRQAEAVKRLYQTKGERFILTAVDGARNRHAVHDPLYCFRGAGWQVVGEQTLELPGGQAKRLALAQSGRRTEVIFWFTDGRERHASALRAWWLGVLGRVTFGQAGGGSALMLLQPVGAETPDWTRVFVQCPFLFEL